MKLFHTNQLFSALDYSENGGQALHVHPFTNGHFLFAQYAEAGHLFDKDKARLIQTARRLGVNKIKIEYEGQPRQHIDLCAGPLRKAKSECENWKE